MRTNLYRIFDAYGDLLYIGISLSAINRLSQHMGDKPWANEIATIKVEQFANRTLAERAERAAIRAEVPRYNVAHNAFAAIVNEPPGRYVDDRDMPDMCHDWCLQDDPEDAVIYFPHRWKDGVAHYVCRRGHRWSCAWGHRQTGHAPWHEGQGYPPSVRIEL